MQPANINLMMSILCCQSDVVNMLMLICCHRSDLLLLPISDCCDIDHSADISLVVAINISDSGTVGQSLALFIFHIASL
jgi:hypothetical protein